MYQKFSISRGEYYTIYIYTHAAIFRADTSYMHAAGMHAATPNGQKNELDGSCGSRE